MPIPYSIKIFLPNGDPDGIRIIEKSNWSGAGLVFPRALLGEAKKRGDLKKPGVYVLVGPAEESGLPTLYIGEGDPIEDRLDNHFRNKDFWTQCIAFVSKDGNLNKAHVQYIESRLVELARTAKRCVLDNSNDPTQSSLSEADKADAEGFLQEMLLCYPVLGLNAFSTVEVPRSKPESILYLNAKGVKAQGVDTPDGFIVKAKSEAVLKTVSSCSIHILQLRSALVENGVLSEVNGKYVFTQDYSFSSPSTASGVVLGRADNGRESWKNKKGVSLKALQQAIA